MDDCIFCRIIKKELPSDIIFEDDLLLAFRDIHPVAPEHILIVPKKHMTNVLEAQKGDEPLLGRMMYAAKDIANTLGFANEGFQLLTRNGSKAGQDVMHLHMHVLSGGKF